MVVIAPCLLSPYTVYRGAVEEDLTAAAAVRKFLGHNVDIAVLSYPCPELTLVGFPRPPAPREVYERLGMRTMAERVAAFVARVVDEEESHHVVLVGVRGSPTCAAATTTSGNPNSYPYGLLERFRSLPREERLRVAEELAASFEPLTRPGILFELLHERVAGTYLEFDKGRIAESIASLEAALR
jgi:dephospho-CoA kinase